MVSIYLHVLYLLNVLKRKVYFDRNFSDSIFISFSCILLSNSAFNTRDLMILREFIHSIHVI